MAVLTSGVMSMDGVAEALDDVTETLERMQKSRDALLGGSRRVITMCSSAIMDIHRGDEDAAVRMLEQAAPLLESLRLGMAQRTEYNIISAEQEYVEASVLLAIVRGDRISAPSALSVLPESYVLGLLDVIGELKRLMLDMMRSGRIRRAVEIFGTMDDLYGMLYKFAAYDKILKESRRKLDVGRMVLESSRLAITEEKRRQEMAQAMAGVSNDSAGDGI